MKLFTQVFSALLFLLSVPAFCQVNTEQFRKSHDSLGFAGEGDIQFSVQAGNSDLQIFKGRFRLNYNGGTYYTFLITGGDYGWNNGEQISNEAIFHMRHVGKLNPILQAELFAQADYSNSRKLDLRKLAGAGLRIKLYRDETSRFYAGVGLMFEDEKYSLPDGSVHPHSVSGFRSTNYLNGQINFSPQVSFYSTVYYQPYIKQISDYKILGESGFNAALSESFALTASLAYRFDNKPPDGIKKYDLNTNVGFAFSF